MCSVLDGEMWRWRVNQQALVTKRSGCFLSFTAKYLGLFLLRFSGDTDSMFTGSGKLVMKCRCLFKYKCITVNRYPGSWLLSFPLLLLRMLAPSCFSSKEKIAHTALSNVSCWHTWSNPVFIFLRNENTEKSYRKDVEVEKHLFWGVYHSRSYIAEGWTKKPNQLMCVYASDLKKDELGWRFFCFQDILLQSLFHTDSISTVRPCSVSCMISVLCDCLISLKRVRVLKHPSLSLAGQKDPPCFLKERNTVRLTFWTFP